MFCPLCKAEYREGFDQCNDCGLPLGSEHEARATETALLYRGFDEASARAIADELMEAGIHFRLAGEPRPLQGLADIFAYTRNTRLLEVRILATDMGKALQRGIPPVPETAPGPFEFTVRGWNRKRFLQIGGGLMIASIILMPWANASWLARETANDPGGIRLLAHYFLFGAGFLARLGSIAFLLMAWTFRLDKIGRVALLFLMWSTFLLVYALDLSTLR